MRSFSTILHVSANPNASFMPQRTVMEGWLGELNDDIDEINDGLMGLT